MVTNCFGNRNFMPTNEKAQGNLVFFLLGFRGRVIFWVFGTFPRCSCQVPIVFPLCSQCVIYDVPISTSFVLSTPFFVLLVCCKCVMNF
jgi:hypothetical protein